MDKGGLFSYETFVHAVAGSTGSVTAMACFYPLDTVRCRLQLDDARKAKSTPVVIQELVREEGFLTLYRGMVPVLQSLCASNFVYFYAFHGLRALIAKGNHGAFKDLILGCVAGVINVLTTTPLWVVNTRLKLQGARIGGISGAKGKPRYANLIDGLMKIQQQEGASALWSGTLPSLILVSNPAIQFMVYEAIKRRLQVDRQTSSWVIFFVAAVAKTVSTVLTYPLQVLQSRLRSGHQCPGLSKHADMLDIAAYILKTQGFKGMYKGMESKLLQTVLTSALMFVFYEKIATVVFALLKGKRVR